MLWLLLLLSGSLAANVLILSPTIGQSHVYTLGNIADILHKRGHNVTVLSITIDGNVKPFGTKENVTKLIHQSKYLDISEHGKMPASTGEIWSVHPATVDLSNFDHYYRVCEMYRNATRGLLEDKPLLKSLIDSKFDVGITEPLELSGVSLLEVLGIRRNVIMSCIGPHTQFAELAGMPEFSSFTPIWLTSYTDKMSFYERYVNFKLSWKLWQVSRTVDSETQKLFNEYYPEMPNVRDVYRKHTRVIFTNVNEFTEIPRLRTNMIQYVGGANYYDNPISKKYDAMLSVRPQTVLFSMGSIVLSCHMPLEIKQAFANAFSAFPNTTFIWKYERCLADTFDQTQYKNIIFQEWIPQSELLQDPRLVLFITHAGLNSVVESFFSGTPMITIPMFVDQMHHAANAVKRGLARQIDRSHINTQVLIENIAKIIEKNSSYQQKAAGYKKLLTGRNEEYREEINRWIERIAEFDSESDNLALAYKDMSYLEIYNLDIIVCISFITLVMVIILRSLALTRVNWMSFLVKTKKE